MKTILTFWGLLCLFTPIFAQEITTPRATAIGGFVAVSDDIFATDWNLAGVFQKTHKLQVAFTSINSKKFGHVRLQYRPWRRHLITIFSTPEFQTKLLIDKLPSRPTFEEFDPLYVLGPLKIERDFGVGYGFQFTDKLSAAALWKRQKFLNRFSDSRFWSLDLSLFYSLFSRVKLGAVLRNIIDRQTQLPPTHMSFVRNDSLIIMELDFESFTSVISKPEKRIDFGASIKLRSNLLLAFDLFSNGDYGFGYEWEPFRRLFFRNGYSHKHDGLYKRQKIVALTWGAGFEYHNARFDIAYYFAYDTRDVLIEQTTFGEFVMKPRNNSYLLLSAAFFLH